MPKLEKLKNVKNLLELQNGGAKIEIEILLII
nr:MAG TPA: hypothetical protein [Caudoviricetes sp.]DAN85312.1 MAG TPA: hypothetical protein [Caudoviricetes sp.]DAS54386.1 MAG TPA: hypothetical protein [Caudoviricetes sp.]